MLFVVGLAIGSYGAERSVGHDRLCASPQDRLRLGGILAAGSIPAAMVGAWLTGAMPRGLFDAGFATARRVISRASRCG